MISAAEGPLLTVFAAVVRHGSFSAAARELKVSKSVISERVRLLEERAGARLLERTTRKLRLTGAGAEVLEAATRVEDALGQLSRSLDEKRREPTGVLRVATTSDLGVLLVAPVAARLVGAYPGLRVEVLAEDALRDVLEAGVDVAVRLGAPRSSSFVIRKLAVAAEPIVAAPAIADRLGSAARPRDLADAPWVRHAIVTGGTMRFTGPGGAVEEIAPRFRAEASSGGTVLGLILEGAGVGVFPDYALQEHLAAGRLVRLCPGWEWKRVTLYALTASRSSRSPAIQAFLSMLRERIGSDAWRWGASHLA